MVLSEYMIIQSQSCHLSIKLENQVSEPKELIRTKNSKNEK